MGGSRKKVAKGAKVALSSVFFLDLFGYPTYFVNMPLHEGFRRFACLADRRGDVAELREGEPFPGHAIPLSDVDPPSRSGKRSTLGRTVPVPEIDQRPINNNYFHLSVNEDDFTKFEFKIDLT